MVDVTVVVTADSSKHYSDNGEKFKDSTGNSSSFSFTTTLTADLFETVTPGVDTKTISYFIDQIHLNVVPEGRFQGINVTEASVNNMVTLDFQAFVEDIEITRTPANGVYTIGVSGEIKTFTSSLRS